MNRKIVDAIKKSKKLISVSYSINTTCNNDD